MGRVTVAVPGSPYPVVTGAGALQELGPWLRDRATTHAFVVTDSNVAARWLEVAEASLTGAGVRCDRFVFPAGEASKTLATWTRALDAMASAGLDRHGVVVALGGGVPGDLGGFAAASWLRGVALVQVPTTLLAMVDSAVGGKTGVDTERSKNAVGAFWQPAAVFADLATLDTLPEDEYLAAFGEVVKYAVSLDAELEPILREQAAGLRARDRSLLELVVDRCVAAKAAVVAGDEREAGRRAVLNYGHTVGHGFEVASGYRAAHGRAVALGMRAAARIAERMRLCEPELPALQERLLAAYGLPGPLPEVAPAAVLEAIAGDKKRRDGTIQWVLPRRLGRADTGVRVPDELVRDVVAETVEVRR